MIGNRQRSVPVVIVAVAVIAYLSRGFRLFAHPELWAEDGRNFLVDSRTLGVAAFVEPYAGYLHAVPRLLAWLGSFLPLHTVPMFYLLASAATYLVATTPVLSERLSWLIPSRTARALAYLMLCLLPVMQEAYGTICNLIFVGGCALVLISLLNDPNSRVGRLGEAAVVGVLGLSGPFSMLLWPTFVYRAYRQRWSRQSVVVLGVVLATAAVQCAFAISTDRVTHPGHNYPRLLLFSILRIAGSVSVGPFVSPRAPIVLPIFCAIWLAVFLVAAFGYLPRLTAVLSLCVIGLVVTFVIAWGDELQWEGGADRHWMIPQTVLVVLGVAIACRPNPKWGRVVMLVLGALAIPVTVIRFPILEWGVHTDMREVEGCVAHNPECVVPISPPGWTMTVTAESNRWFRGSRTART